jgi:hypothetical protein
MSRRRSFTDLRTCDQSGFAAGASGSNSSRVRRIILLAAVGSFPPSSSTTVKDSMRGWITQATSMSYIRQALAGEAFQALYHVEILLRRPVGRNDDEGS